jgi:hypothetical protein
MLRALLNEPFGWATTTRAIVRPVDWRLGPDLVLCNVHGQHGSAAPIAPEMTPVRYLDARSTGLRQSHGSVHWPRGALDRAELATAQEAAQLNGDTVHALNSVRCALTGPLRPQLRTSLRRGAVRRRSVRRYWHGLASLVQSELDQPRNASDIRAAAGCLGPGLLKVGAGSAAPRTHGFGQASATGAAERAGARYAGGPGTWSTCHSVSIQIARPICVPRGDTPPVDAMAVSRSHGSARPECVCRAETEYEDTRPQQLRASQPARCARARRMCLQA